MQAPEKTFSETEVLHILVLLFVDGVFERGIGWLNGIGYDLADSNRGWYLLQQSVFQPKAKHPTSPPFPTIENQKINASMKIGSISIKKYIKISSGMHHTEELSNISLL